MKFDTEIEKFAYRQKLIDEVIDWFDFDKVAKVMLFLDWKWKYDPNPPDIQELRDYVRKALRDTFDRYISTGIQSYHNSGGFEITCMGDDTQIWFDVKFTITEWCTYDEKIN